MAFPCPIYIFQTSAERKFSLSHFFFSYQLGPSHLKVLPAHPCLRLHLQGTIFSEKLRAPLRHNNWKGVGYRCVELHFTLTHFVAKVFHISRLNSISYALDCVLWFPPWMCFPSLIFHKLMKREMKYIFNDVFALSCVTYPHTRSVDVCKSKNVYSIQRFENLKHFFVHNG